ncbi:DUF3783 domain-containing protein [Deferribacterales bacterium Es71-Z0220]|jgi:hypothetical protein|uniref:DUF3783 domain-containing protein n=1 Tax=Deferrivibrio essentukiensis TaxID=2880922 RepID=UPI001F622BE9|nr:DUF3783 domain-containing protein [Deferrivibrio essentukiensis]MBZ4672263.1 hypothetical protein [Deferribacteraceae bacterium]MCB4203605.1 DUF3783 domain-containing protein [Deferrivibrio essentukiensis]
MENKYIYVAGFGDIEFDIIKKMAEENEYPQLIRIFENHLDIKIQDLKVESQTKGNTIKVRVILFENMDNKIIIDFINKFKTLKLPQSIFAIVTEHNKQWTFKELASHLIKEHQEMHQKKENV